MAFANASLGHVIDDESAAAAERATFEAKVLRAFLRDDRLVLIPAHDRKRRVILRWLMTRCFTEDRDYPEKEVNMCLALVHQDVAALRRSLVEAGLMTRQAGLYRPVPAPLSDGAPQG